MAEQEQRPHFVFFGVYFFICLVIALPHGGELSALSKVKVPLLVCDAVAGLRNTTGGVNLVGQKGSSTVWIRQPLGTYSVSVYWGDTDKRLLTVQRENDPSATVIHFPDDITVFVPSYTPAYITNRIKAIDLRKKPSRSAVWRSLRISGNTEVRPSCLWIVTAWDMVLLLFEPGRVIILTPLVLVPLSALRWFFPLWFVVVFTLSAVLIKLGVPEGKDDQFTS